MPEPVGLNGLLPGRGPGLGAPGRGAGATPPAWPGLAEPGAGRAWPPSSALAAGRSGCENGTWGTPAAGSPPSGPVASPGPAGGLPTPGCAVAAGRSSAGCDAASSPSAMASADAGAARPLAARLAPSAELPPSADCARAALAAAAWSANASLSLRTTGASIVDDAERTNSPISWSLAITALLSTPNSFASSYTRTFATALPYLVRLVPDPCGAGPGLCSGRRQTLLFIAAFSSGAHHDRILLSRQCRSCRNLTRAPRTAGPDTPRARRCPKAPAGAAPGQTPFAAPLARSISG